jgi:hypothetical protein
VYTSLTLPAIGAVLQICVAGKRPAVLLQSLVAALNAKQENRLVERLSCVDCAVQASG